MQKLSEAVVVFRVATWLPGPVSIWERQKLTEQEQNWDLADGITIEVWTWVICSLKFGDPSDAVKKCDNWRKN